VSRVLVVEDAPDLRLLLRLVLQDDGLEVAEAGAGPDALVAMRREPADVILLDVQMPSMDGWDVLRTIRSDPRTADLPVVLCTVKGAPTDRARGWRLGCDGYVAKPFDIAEVVATVRSVMSTTPDDRAARRADAIRELEQSHDAVTR